MLDHPPNETKKPQYSILRKSDSTSLYLTREIASIIQRDELFQADRYLYVVDKAQKQHFQALKIVLDRFFFSSNLFNVSITEWAELT